jgi:hypothetical protein
MTTDLLLSAGTLKRYNDLSFLICTVKYFQGTDPLDLIVVLENERKAKMFQRKLCDL